MKDQYSINEILNAIDDLQNLKKERKIDPIILDKTIPKRKRPIKKKPKGNKPISDL